MKIYGTIWHDKDGKAIGTSMRCMAIEICYRGRFSLKLVQANFGPPPAQLPKTQHLTQAQKPKLLT
ncbi:hypothetical protein E1A91_A09G178800v1 [Gossypium mustelinum]|uniref:Uncharacterized protein n=1 Tax=Gossypium mustelinum TaxID=34275 RepID=A0A5D2XZ84_GOSMU|nr:hypothetical protein E1A91_A09G178800v1 [Gossypium mustelinum]